MPLEWDSTLVSTKNKLLESGFTSTYLANTSCIPQIIESTSVGPEKSVVSCDNKSPGLPARKEIFLSGGGIKNRGITDSSFLATTKRKKDLCSVHLSKRILPDTKAKSSSLENHFLKKVDRKHDALKNVSNALNLKDRTFLRQDSLCLADKRENELRVSHDSKIPRKIFKGPEYKFSSVVFKQPDEEIFESVENNPELDVQNRVKEVQSIKSAFVTAVCTSLLHSPNFKDNSNATRQQLIEYADAVYSVDPEFILKVALYTRQELNIRSTANFILAYAAYCEKCRPFLQKYFSASICLPSDWIDVAEQYQIFDDSRLKFRSLPSSLRKVMKTTFKQFDQYQLAKYNRVSGKKKKKKIEEKVETEHEEEGVTEESIAQKTFTLKQLIRTLHITHPVETVMCLLGKKYPADFENFKKSSLPGEWMEEKAGSRMKLPTPETWEVEVSLHGNKPEIWEGLLDHKKLPYMAMLRNLRNILLAGISKSHHKKVMQTISKPIAVINSRQFPLRFYSAYKAIEELNVLLKKQDIISSKNNQFSSNQSSAKEVKNWQIQNRNKLLEKLKNCDDELLEKYKVAVDKAVEIATVHNLDPIQGKTLVICDLVTTYEVDCPALKTAPGKLNKLYHGSLMLGMMCLHACEACELKIITGPTSWETVTTCDDSILNNVNKIATDFKVACVSMTEESKLTLLYKQTLFDLLHYYLQAIVIQREKLDNIVFLTNGKYFDNSVGPEVMSSFLNKYRHVVNPDLFYVQVDLTGSFSSNRKSYLSHEKDVHLWGFSDQLLRFVAEGGNRGQLSYVEKIDQKYNLKHVYRPSLSNITEDQLKPWSSAKSHQPVWRTLRVFISSTFKDMHGERDVLVNYVFPELRARAKSLCINVREVDLRWGITEAETTSQRSLELCLSEVLQCQFFIGILGERYGYIPEYNLPNDPHFDWVREYPPGASVTELEMHCGALASPGNVKDKAFFYIRDNSFISDIPEVWKPDFESEGDVQVKKMSHLKQRIRNSGLEVFDGYRCEWGGIINGCPFVRGLEEFGQRVLDNLWNAICKLFAKDDRTEEMEERSLQTSFAQSFHNFTGRETLMKKCIADIKAKDGVFLITGKPGSGKTAFLASLSQKITSHPRFFSFIDASLNSSELHHMLYSLCKDICSDLSIPHLIPDSLHGLVSQFYTVLKKGVEASPTGCLILVIDGLDHLPETEAQGLDWLPHSFPQGVKLLCSASEGSEAFDALKKRSKLELPLHMTCIDPLDLAERQNMVRNCLKPHRKTLDESPFNNQLLLLVTKQDAGYPLFLHLACEELKSFRMYEKLTEKIRSLPSNMISLLQGMISELEMMHSKDIIRSSLCLLSLAKEGLEEQELHTLLSITCLNDKSFCEISQKVYAIKSEHLLTPLFFGLLLHCLQQFIHPIGEKRVMKLAFTEISKIVAMKYLSSLRRKEVKMFHKLLAGYFLTTIDPENNQTWQGYSVRCYRALLHHLAKSECYKDLSKILCNLTFLEAAFKVGLGHYLLDHFLFLKKVFHKMYQSSQEWVDPKKIEDYYFFVSNNMHILKNYPCLTRQQALNCWSGSSVYCDALLTMSNLWVVEWMTKPNHSDSCYLTLSEFAEPVLCGASLPKRNVVVLGGQDGVSRLVDGHTGKVLKLFTGHSNSVIAVCFVGEKKLCTASLDKTLCLWDIEKGFRLAVMSGHKRRVNCCCSDSVGNTVISGSWDRTIRLWSSTDGREISCISDISCPVNCVCFHPERQCFVYGGWDKNVVVYDAVSLRRISVLKGHSSSIQSVAVTSSGLHIISSSMCGEVFCWSLDAEVQVSRIMESNPTVNYIALPVFEDHLITASTDWTLKAWSTQKAAVACHLPNISSTAIRMIEFLSSDCLLSISEDGMMVAFEINTNKILCQCHESEVTCVSGYYDVAHSSLLGIIFGTSKGLVKIIKFDQDKSFMLGALSASITAIVGCGPLVLTATSDGEIAIYHSKRRSCISLNKSHSNAITFFGLDKEHCKLLTADADKKLHVWCVNPVWVSWAQENDNNPLTHIKTLHFDEDIITAACCAGDYLVMGSQDSTVKILHKEKDVCIGKGLSAPAKYLSVKEDCIYVGGIDGSVAVFSNNGTLLHKLPAQHEDQEVPAAHVFSPGDKTKALVASVVQDGGITIWKPFSEGQLTTLQGHRASLTSACMLDRNVVVSCSLDKCVRFWNLDQEEQRPEISHKGKVTSVGWMNLKSKFSFSTDSEGLVVIWNNLPDNSLKSVCHLQYCQGCIITALWIPSGNHLMCAVSQNSDATHFVDLLTVESVGQNASFFLRKKRTQSFSAEVLCIDYATTEDIVAICIKSGIVYLANGDLDILNEIKSCEEWILTAKFSSKKPASLFLTTSDGRIISCKNTGEIEQLPSLPLEDPTTETSAWSTALLILINNECWIGDSCGRLTLLKEGTTKCWKVHSDSITSVCHSGNFLFTTSLDSTFKVWNLNSMEQVGMFHSPVPISSMAISAPETSGQPVILLCGTVMGEIHLFLWKHFK